LATGGEPDDSHGGAAGDFAGVRGGEVCFADDVDKDVYCGGEGFGGDEAGAGLVDFFERLHEGLEFGEVGPLGELVWGGEQFGGEVFGGD
jgi:hypothetical protein